MDLNLIFSRLFGVRFVRGADRDAATAATGVTPLCSDSLSGMCIQEPCKLAGYALAAGISLITSMRSTSFVLHLLKVLLQLDTLQSWRRFWRSKSSSPLA
eukprot:1622812-Amphidinium_carterae.1